MNRIANPEGNEYTMQMASKNQPHNILWFVYQ